MGLYYYNARWYDPALGRFIQADTLVPSQNRGTEDSKQLQVLLVVDYHEPYLLTQLDELYKADLQNDPKTPGQALKTDRLYFNPTDNKREQNHPEDTRFSNDAFRPLVDFNGTSPQWKQPDDEDKNNKNNLVDRMPARMNSMGFDRYAYTSNCPTKYTDPTGRKECNIAELIIGGLAVVGSEIPAVVAGGVSLYTTMNPYLAFQVFEAVNEKTYPAFLIGIGLIIYSGCVKT